MRKIFVIASAMVISVVMGFAALGIGFYCLDLARAGEAAATSDFAQADAVYARLERTLDKARHIPWILDAARADLMARRALLSYRQGDYASILEAPEVADENGKKLTPSLRFIRANALFRMAAGEKSREKVIQTLGRGIREYASVIGDDPTFSDAAFNYEYAVMLRNDIAGGRRPVGLLSKGIQKPGGNSQEMFGEEGAEPQARGQKRMKVLVPREGDEDPEKKGQEPSKGSAKKKFG